MLERAIGHIERRAAELDVAPRDYMLDRILDVKRDGTLDNREPPAACFRQLRC